MTQEQRQKMSVNLGDRYTKAGSPAIVWTISRILEDGNLIPHVVLAHEGRPDRQITLSVPALEMASLYTTLKSSLGSVE